MSTQENTMMRDVLQLTNTSFMASRHSMTYRAMQLLVHALVRR